MSHREPRNVPEGWEHPRSHRDDDPRDDDGRFIPLFPRSALSWNDEDPDCNIKEEDVMPDFGDTATHLMMYERTSEGTPISPAFRTPEELARWLTDNKASVFAGMTMGYEDWLETIGTGLSPPVILTPRD